MPDLICPPIDAKLIDYLKKIFIDQCPDIKDSDRDIWVSRGRVDVVKHLEFQLKEQERVGLQLTLTNL